MQQRVQHVIDVFRDIAPDMFSDKLNDALQASMQHIKRGCASDHPDVQLYHHRPGSSQAQFNRLRSDRGSSRQENLHRHLNKTVGGRVGSPELISDILVNATFRWNIDRGK
jgi:hypothetical protein